jgi:methylamine dehydrogenase accessory protein MauD
MPTGLWLWSYLALWVLLGLVTLLLAAVIRQVGELHAYWVAKDPEHGLPLGVPAPALDGTDLYGRSVALAPAGKTLLFFVSRGCLACQTAMKLMGTIHRLPGIRLVLIVQNSENQTREFVEEYHRESEFPDALIVVDFEREIGDEYKATATPYAVLVEKERILAKGIVSEGEHFQSLLDHAERRRKWEAERTEREALQLSEEPVVTGAGVG